MGAESITNASAAARLAQVICGIQSSHICTIFAPGGHPRRSLINVLMRTEEDHEDRSTLVGRLSNQAALSGLLNSLYEAQHPVLSVECLEIG